MKGLELNVPGRGLLLLASAMMLVSCGNNKVKFGKDDLIGYGEIGYSDIVSFLVEGFTCKWEDMSPEEMELSPVYSYNSSYAGFAQADIDGDGFDELLIGDQFEDGSYALYDIYCFSKKDASLIHLASGGERDTFVINGDGTIIESGSNSAEDSFTMGFTIKNDKLVKASSWDDSLMALNLEKFSKLAKPRQLPGGYNEMREPTGDELAMFNAATAGSGMNFTPMSVSTQVVAGTNYKFRCRSHDKDGDGFCQVVIFKPLPGQGEPKVTSIDME